MSEEQELCHDIQMKLPDDIWMLDELERYRRGARFTPDFATFEGKTYVFGVVTVPLNYVEDEFTWGCWAEVSPELHDAYLEAFRTPGAAAVSGEGRLANAVPGYDDSLGATVTITFFEDRRPAFEVDPETTLGTEQVEGMTAEGHRELDHLLFDEDDEFDADEKDFEEED